LRPYALVAAAAVPVVVASAALLPRDTPDAVSLLSSAAETTAEVTSLRIALTEEDQYSDSTVTIEVAGGDRMRVQVYGTYRDGHVEGSTTVYMGVDSYEETLDGHREAYRIDQPIPPFDSSTQAVLAAALSGDQVAVVGQETVRDVPTTHYRITVDDAARAALADVDPMARSWLDLEDLETVRTVDVWIGGDLIRRVRVESEDSVSTAEYYDFGARIDIQPPDWAGTVTPAG
jgi:hypothetical protein